MIQYKIARLKPRVGPPAPHKLRVVWLTVVSVLGVGVGRQEEQEFKVIFSSVVRLRVAWDPGDISQKKKKCFARCSGVYL